MSKTSNLGCILLLQMRYLASIMVVLMGVSTSGLSVHYPRREECCREGGTFGMARAEWRETLTAYIISLDVPGIKEQDLNITADPKNYVLHVTGHRNKTDIEDEDEDVDEEYHGNSIIHPPYLDDETFADLRRRFNDYERRHSIFLPPYLDEKIYGNFWRRFKLPDSAVLSSLQTRLQDGVLRITIPKYVNFEKLFLRPRYKNKIKQPLMHVTQ